jgi:hypothetical protein
MRFAGSDAAEYGPDVMAVWRTDLYRRVRAHVSRVKAAAAARSRSHSILTCTCSSPPSPVLATPTPSGKREATEAARGRARGVQVDVEETGAQKGREGAWDGSDGGRDCSVRSVDEDEDEDEGARIMLYPRVVAFTGKKHFAGASHTPHCNTSPPPHVNNTTPHTTPHQPRHAACACVSHAIVR